MTIHADTVIDSVGIQQVRTSVYRIPTDAPEADGTLSWQSTTMILVEIEAGGLSGTGYTYAQEATAAFIHTKLAPLLAGRNTMDIEEINGFLIRQVRNSGTCGLSMMAVSAIDNALWDLKARLLGIPLCKLLGQVHDKMLLYGSGGFTSYSQKQLQSQMKHWSDQGFQYLKMKVGAEPAKDVQRVKDARDIIGQDVKLMIDANGAYTVQQALEIASTVNPYNVMWMEEPVSSDNLQGLQFIRQHLPPGINVAAGEYGYNLPYFQSMLQHNAVDVLQADATRCGGISGFIKAAHLAEAWQVPFSSHCAPLLHLHAAVSLPSFFIAEYFHDHVRIEKELFDGFPDPGNGYMVPDLSLKGAGYAFRHRQAEKYKI